jgi:hypothetical protein
MRCSGRNKCVQVMQYKRLVAAEFAKAGSTEAAVQVCFAASVRTTHMATCSWHIMSSIVINNNILQDNCAFVFVSRSTALPGVSAAVTFLADYERGDAHCAKT